MPPINKPNHQVPRLIIRFCQDFQQIYGVIFCNAWTMGEFGAVSVVSGHIRGQTNTTAPT